MVCVDIKHHVYLLNIQTHVQQERSAGPEIPPRVLETQWKYLPQIDEQSAGELRSAICKGGQ